MRGWFRKKRRRLVCAGVAGQRVSKRAGSLGNLSALLSGGLNPA